MHTIKDNEKIIKRKEGYHKGGHGYVELYLIYIQNGSYTVKMDIPIDKNVLTLTGNKNEDEAKEIFYKTCKHIIQY